MPAHLGSALWHSKESDGSSKGLIDSSTVAPIVLKQKRSRLIAIAFHRVTPLHHVCTIFNEPLYKTKPVRYLTGFPLGLILLLSHAIA
ncbi:hypothetical protein [Nostoc sp. JL23]|uniref:hypothetical protein n=1 Tax=Nostoc sp. JL23 TaxID=2815394 RepID=UPI001D54CEFF|nr:hypothetical protein [Nostoc sp. JL23]MBN3875277.1 hypothetical protein [Nostoc sp. JL23]